jgi:hypothetical protein
MTNSLPDCLTKGSPRITAAIVFGVGFGVKKWSHTAAEFLGVDTVLLTADTGGDLYTDSDFLVSCPDPKTNTEE